MDIEKLKNLIDDNLGKDEFNHIYFGNNSATKKAIRFLKDNNMIDVNIDYLYEKNETSRKLLLAFKNGYNCEGHCTYGDYDDIKLGYCTRCGEHCTIIDASMLLKPKTSKKYK